MKVNNALQEIVLLFDTNGTSIQQAMSFEEFEALTSNSAALPDLAASTIKAAYAVVGKGLHVCGVVFFQFRINEEGLLDGTFNLPLRYLVRHAGLGPDLDMNPFRLACRSQCPVPWHSMNLWEPKGKGDAHPAKLVQKAVWRNSMGLKPVPAAEGFGVELDTISKPAAANGKPAKRAKAPASASRSPAELGAVSTVKAQMARHEQRLTATFGEEGRLNVSLLAQQHRQQIEQITQQHRSEVNDLQRNYLDQIRNCRAEIQKLKAALRNEQERSRRLQGLLRGDV
jgi:hypothetical protein